MEKQARGGGLVGQWVRDRCNKEGWSLREAAANTGLSHATIGDIMKGGQPSSESIRKLAAAFGGNGNHQKCAVEDEILTLAGYRSERPEGEISESMGRLLDRLSTFSETQLKVIGRFADFLAEVEGK